MTLLLVAAFFATALLYASVGFGGGSTYSALLIISGVDYRILPAIALVCNVIVVTGGVVRFRAAGELPIRQLLPYLVTSVPAAWIGGRLPISETLFVGLLGGALLVSGIHLALQKEQSRSRSMSRIAIPAPVGMAIGGAIGLLSGLVGIGGGIFLAPILYALGWGTPRQIAGASSLFILANSIAGLAGQISKLQDLEILAMAVPYWPLPLAVLFGGQIGSWFASRRLSPSIIRRLTAALILYVAIRLLLRWLESF
ncbi:MULTISPECIES: sulfite exporter TauE/SafE family protein [Hyphobacterium]|uniref:Probable membrane transporter protein n=1 Tax=Hyphobacterium vulgare TaxID=1736751 RepID=A0ABV6ZVT6_9PROT